MFIKNLLFFFIVFLGLYPSLGLAETRVSKPKVVATTGIVADIIQNVAGDFVELEALMGPGVDPHLYKPSHKDISRLRKAKIIIYNGLNLEGKLEPILKKLAKKKKVIAAAELGGSQLFLAAENYADAYDPHIWFDLQLWALASLRIGSALAFELPDHRVQILDNTFSYLQKIAATEKWVVEQIASVPAEQRVLITAHDAFRYFGKRYGVQVRGLQGISTTADYGLRDVKDIADLIVNKRIKSIFMESSVPAKFIESLQKVVKAKGYQVEIGETLYSDALGPKDSNAETYLTMIRHNVLAITAGLKGANNLKGASRAH